MLAPFLVPILPVLGAGTLEVSEPVVGSFGMDTHTGTLKHARSRIVAVSVRGTLGEGVRTCMIGIFGMGQALFFHPRKNEENHHGSVWRIETFKPILFFMLPYYH